MTNQLQGEILSKGWSGSTAADWVYTPWIPVRGNFAVFGVQVTYAAGATLTWNVETRTLEEPGTTPTILSGNQTDTGGVLSSTAAKELVRYKFNTGSGASTTDFVVFRALQPSWQFDR
jgi:hypothetical protein